MIEQKQSLPLEYWGLERWPFRTAPAVDQLYPTAGYTEALARIDYLVEGRRRLGVLLGEPGVGKSIVLQAVTRQLGRQRRAVALLDALGSTSRELLWKIAASLGAAPNEDADIARLWRQVGDRAQENRLQQVHTVLLVDDAGHAGPDLITQFARLARLDPSAFARWTIVLAAEAAQAARWNDMLRDLVDLRIDLRRWELDETIGYVQTALVDAGRLEPLFEEPALVALHELAGGIPRQTARIADFALLAGAAAGLEVIDAATVEAAHEEIAWPAAMAL